MNIQFNNLFYLLPIPIQCFLLEIVIKFPNVSQFKFCEIKQTKMSVPEVVISVSKQPGTVHVDNKLEPGDAIFVWELKTGSVLASYKPVSE